MFQVNFYQHGYTKYMTPMTPMTYDHVRNLVTVTGEVSARALRRLADRIPGGITNWKDPPCYG